MSIHFFAIRIETFRVVAAEIHDGAAAALLDAGQPILLGTVEELSKLAARLGRPLLTISRAPTRLVSRRTAMPARTSPALPTPAAIGARTRTVQGEQHYPAAVQAAGDRQPCVPAIGVA